MVYWWIGFLVVTILSERLELSRLVRFSPWQQATYLAALATLVAGIVATIIAPDAGARLCGLAPVMPVGSVGGRGVGA